MEKVVWDKNDSLSLARKHADSQLPDDIGVSFSVENNSFNNTCCNKSSCCFN